MTELDSVVEGTELYSTLDKEWNNYNAAQSALKNHSVALSYIDDKLCFSFLGVGYQVNAKYKRVVSETSFAYKGEEGYDEENTVDDGSGGGEYTYDGTEETWLEYQGVEATVLDIPTYKEMDVVFFIQRLDADRISYRYGDPKPVTHYVPLNIMSRQNKYDYYELLKDKIEVRGMKREILNRKVAEFIGVNYDTVVAVFGNEVSHLDTNYFSIPCKKGISNIREREYVYLGREKAQELVKKYTEASEKGNRAVIKGEQYSSLPSKIAFVNLEEEGYTLA
jgi:hypothetical protein